MSEIGPRVPELFTMQITKPSIRSRRVAGPRIASFYPHCEWIKNPRRTRFETRVHEIVTKVYAKFQADSPSRLGTRTSWNCVSHDTIKTQVLSDEIKPDIFHWWIKVRDHTVLCSTSERTERGETEGYSLVRVGERLTSKCGCVSFFLAQARWGAFYFV